MRRLGALLEGLPAAGRWALLGVGGALLVLLVGLGARGLLQAREARAALAFATATAGYHEALASGRGEATGAVAEALTGFIRAYPRSAAAAQAWYLLGNLRYAQRDYDGALRAFEEAVRRDRGTVGALSRLGMGYAHEAKGDLPRALATYQEALAGRGARDFLYAELLLATARVHEQLRQPAAAVEAYRRLLRDLPEAPQAEEVRARLAALGADSS